MRGCRSSISGAIPIGDAAAVLVLVGFMGAGKTTVGRLVAARCGLQFADSDVLIESRSGRTIAEIFASDGEPHFRELERQAVAELVRGHDLVVSLGGGAVEDVGSQRLLRRAPVVYLQVSYETALARVGGDGGRPMLARADLAEVYRRRGSIFAAIASLTVATDRLSPDEVAGEVIAGLGL